MKKFFVCCALVLALASCSTKQHAINQLENFSYELRDNSARYTAEEWNDAGEKFVDIRKKIAKHEFDYTPEEKERIGRLEGECARYMRKGLTEGFFDKVRGAYSEIKGILSGILGL